MRIEFSLLTITEAEVLIEAIENYGSDVCSSEETNLFLSEFRIHLKRLVLKEQAEINRQLSEGIPF